MKKKTMEYWKTDMKTWSNEKIKDFWMKIFFYGVAIMMFIICIDYATHPSPWTQAAIIWIQMFLLFAIFFVLAQIRNALRKNNWRR